MGNGLCCCFLVTQLCPTLCNPMDTRLPCPLPSSGACPNLCPLSEWCHPTIPSSVTLFSSCLQSFPASGSFPMSQLFASGGHRVGASPSVLPVKIHSWFPLELTGWISLQSKGLSRVFSRTIVRKHQFFSTQTFSWSSSNIHTWPLEKPSLWWYAPLSSRWCLCLLISCVGLCIQTPLHPGCQIALSKLPCVAQQDFVSYSF